MRYVVAMVCACHRHTLGEGEAADLRSAVLAARDLRARLAGDSGCWIIVRPVSLGFVAW